MEFGEWFVRGDTEQVTVESTFAFLIRPAENVVVGCLEDAVVRFCAQNTVNGIDLIIRYRLAVTCIRLGQ